MGGVKVEAEIGSGATRVFEYLATIEHQADWMPLIASVEHVGGVRGQVGARYTQVSTGPGAKTAGQLEIVECEPSTRLVTRAAAGPLKLEWTYELRDEGDSTHLMLTVDAGAMGAMAAPIIRKQLKMGLDNLKAALDTS
jgi:uncharacterized protein YndB with AHSA1/START domain